MSNNFYNAISKNYDELLTSEDSKTRIIIENIYKRNLKVGANAMDFGGGTGLDLKWLSENNTVYFLEPSDGMREIAKSNWQQSQRQANIVFVEEKTDFNSWAIDNLPFNAKLDAVLANFAVINCFENISTFFKNVSLLCNEKCILLMTVIDSRPLAVLKKYGIRRFIKILFNNYTTITNTFEDSTQTVYLHSIKSIIHSSRPHFEFQESVPVPNSNFVVLLFKKL